MSRSILNFITDLLTALVMLGILGTGLVIKFVLPPGSGSRRAVWTLTRHDWGDVHFWLAVAAGVLLLIHIALHWQWVCTMTLQVIRPKGARHPGRLMRNIAGAATLVLLVGLSTGFVWVARGAVREVVGGSERGGGHGGAGRGEGGGRGRESASSATRPATGGENHDSSIRGSMSLADAANALNIPVSDLKAALKLPADTPASERLGRLSHEHGFTMAQVRELGEQGKGSSPGATQPAGTK